MIWIQSRVISYLHLLKQYRNKTLKAFGLGSDPVRLLNKMIVKQCAFIAYRRRGESIWTEVLRVWFRSRQRE